MFTFCSMLKGVREFVVDLAELVQLDEPSFDHGLEAVIDLANAYAHAPTELFLPDFRFVLDKFQYQEPTGFLHEYDWFIRLRRDCTRPQGGAKAPLGRCRGSVARDVVLWLRVGRGEAL